MEHPFEIVEDVEVSPKMSVKELIEAYGKIHGFMAGHLYEAIRILREGLKVSDLRVISFTANLISTGLRGIISQLVRNGLFNAIITTCGTLDHDIARSQGGKYLKGYFDASDTELYKKGYHRLGNIFIPIEDYGLKVENFVRKLAEKASTTKKKWALYELLELAGSLISDKNSILRAAYESKALIFVPGWPDGAFGTSLFMERQRGVNIEVDYMEDMKKLADLFFQKEGKATALLVGGGISKHHAIWWSQFRDGLDYVVYLTTAMEYDGSLSGARPREAITWGKIKSEAKKVVVYGDATVLLPIMAVALSDLAIT